MTTPLDVLRFWFGEQPPSNFDELAAWLLRLGPSIDDEVRNLFGKAIEDALSGGLKGWEETEEGMLALLLVLDQLPRHAFRGTERQYAGDARALRMALGIIDETWVQRLAPERFTHVMLPLAHSEDLPVHERMVVYADSLGARCPDWWGPIATIAPSQARKYREVIRQFGRFPHRNEVLGRASTAAEQAWLDAGNASKMAPDVIRAGLLG